MVLDDALKLVGSGNFKDIEAQWLDLVERDCANPEKIIALQPILEELVERGKTERAESMAWAAVESVLEHGSPADALLVCKPFLLALNKSTELKTLAADLYRQVYAERENLEALVEEAGIAGGRPPRRAIRTLDTCLSIKPGSFVVSRDEDTAACVESIDSENWNVTIKTSRSSETLGPVEFADAHIPCEEDDFRVLASFDKPRLQSTLRKEPVAVIENILRIHDGRIDSDDLRLVLTPRIIATDEWQKWWTKARAAVKKSRHIKMQGRSPYILEYISGGHNIHEEFVADFKHLETPSEQFAAVDGFLRECSAREETPDATVVGKIREALARKAEFLEARNFPAALAERLLEFMIAKAIGESDADRSAVALLSSSADRAGLFRACEVPALWQAAADCLVKARPDDWQEILADQFPWSPGQSCEYLADMLDKSSLLNERIDQTIGTIIAEAESTFEALYWLWDKGLSREKWRSTKSLTILTRILTLLAQVQRGDKLSAAVTRKICISSRTVLSARKYQRFAECLSSIEIGVASALRSQLQRLENLGRKVEEDLLGRLRGAFPDLYKIVHTPIWERKDVLLSTPEGIARVELDIKELVNVKMRENAKAIGDAAEKGDLSENSEYKFALEERDLLRARLAQMQGQFAMARPLYREEVSTDHLTVGCKVTFRHVESGETVELTFLGSFDADVDRRIFNYQAPFAQGLMGSRLGDLVELSVLDRGGSYEIVGLVPWKDDS